MYIYVITNNINDKIYIGKSHKSLKRRWHLHRYAARNGTKTHIANAIRKHGSDNFSIMPILSNPLLTMQQLCDLERYYIRCFHSTDRTIGYNMTDGGEGASGRPSRMKGKRMSEKARQKMSVAKKGIKQSPEVVAKRMVTIRDLYASGHVRSDRGREPWNKGKTGIYSDETRRKISIAQLGRKRTTPYPAWTEERRAAQAERARRQMLARKQEALLKHGDEQYFAQE